MELPRITNHVPPKVWSSAVFITASLPSTKLSPHTPGTTLATKKTPTITRLSPSDASDTTVAVRGP